MSYWLIPSVYLLVLVYIVYSLISYFLYFHSEYVLHQKCMHCQFEKKTYAHKYLLEL